MSKTLKRIIIIAAGLLIFAFVGFNVMRMQTKKHSPETTVVFEQNDLNISVNYSRPSKKGRIIFDGLIPYGKVWRTGANEATTFETNKNLLIDGKVLPAGLYTLWTIPGLDSWIVIFNSEQYGWGVNFDGVASMDPDFNALQTEVVVERLLEPVEMFTISFDDSDSLALVMEWDQTHIGVPIQVAQQ